MTRSVYFYQNEMDLIEFLRFIRALNVGVYRYHGEPFDMSTYRHNASSGTFLFVLESPPAKVCQKCCCVEENAEYIQIFTQYRAGGILQWGSAIVNSGAKDSLIMGVFKSIKKYVRTNYVMADNKLYYVAPGMYEDWADWRVDLPDLFKRSELTTTSEQFSFPAFVDRMRQKGYVIMENGKDIRESDNLNFSKDAYILCPSEASLKTAIVVRELHYLPGSRCVFLWVTRKKEIARYSFQLDARLTGDAELNALFQSIANDIQNEGSIAP